MDSILKVGSSIMGALFGRKSTRATTSARSLNQASAEKADLTRAEESLDVLQNKYRDLEVEFNAAYQDLSNKLQVDKLTFEEVTIPPRKSDIALLGVYLVWLPYLVSPGGQSSRAW